MVLRFIPVFKLVQPNVWMIIGPNKPFLLRHGANVFLALIGWRKPAINFIFYFHILLHDFRWNNLLLVRQWLKIDTQFCTQISVSFSQGFLVLQPWWQCATRNSIFLSNLSLTFHFFVNFIKRLRLHLLWSDMYHIGGCIYDCNNYNSCWTHWQMKFQTSYFVITSTIYTDLMLLELKNHFTLNKLSLYKFRYIPVSLLWKWMARAANQFEWFITNFYCIRKCTSFWF